MPSSPHDRPAQFLPGSWQRVASGSQHEIWRADGGHLVFRAQRRTLANRLAHLVSPVGQRAEVRQRLGELAVPSRAVDRPRWVDAGGHSHQARRGSLMDWVDPEAFLADALWRRPHPQIAAAGVEALLELLDELARRDLHMLDFVSDNFAWWEGALRVVDADLVVPGDALARRGLRVAEATFRFFLARDYRRLLARRAAEARATGDRQTADRLQAAERGFGRLGDSGNRGLRLKSARQGPEACFD